MVERLERVEANQLRIMHRLDIEPVAGVYGEEYRGRNVSTESNISHIMGTSAKKPVEIAEMSGQPAVSSQ